MNLKFNEKQLKFDSDSFYGIALLSLFLIAALSVLLVKLAIYPFVFVFDCAIYICEIFVQKVERGLRGD